MYYVINYSFGPSCKMDRAGYVTCNQDYADIDINTYLISSDDFYKIVQSSPQLLDYWSLRSHFLNYAYSYKNAIETE